MLGQDEPFHIPQAQAYCNGDWSVWDPKITTPPGLWLLTEIQSDARCLTDASVQIRLVSNFKALISLQMHHGNSPSHQRAPPFGPSSDNFSSAGDNTTHQSPEISSWAYRRVYSHIGLSNHLVFRFPILHRAWQPSLCVGMSLGRHERQTLARCIGVIQLLMSSIIQTTSTEESSS